MNIEEIVHLVTNEKLTTKKLWYPSGKSSERDEDITLIEPAKELKGVMTDLVVYEFLKTPSQLCNFVGLVFTTFDQAIILYNSTRGISDKDIFFVYKGGNILRFISNKVFYMLPGRVKEDMLSYYRDAFKKSDADFSIYINPMLDNFDQVFDEITNIAYLVQNYLRNIFLASPKKYFDYYNLSDSAKMDLYYTYLDKLNNTEVLKNGAIPGKFLLLWTPDIDIGKKYIPKKDYEIYFEKKARILEPNSVINTNSATIVNHNTNSATITNQNTNSTITTNQNNKTIKEIDNQNNKTMKEIDNQNNKSITTFVNLKSIHLEEFKEKELTKLALDQLNIYGNISQSEMLISINRTTTFLAHRGVVSFNLVRMKVSFNAIRNIGSTVENDNKYVLDRLDGELIDISIANKQDFNVKHFFDNVERYIVKYNLEEGECNVPFRAYSIDYLIEDLEYILFTHNEYPWQDPKYAKRLKRLIFMYYLSLFLSDEFKNNKDRIQYIYSLKKLVLEPISAMQSSSSDKNFVFGKVEQQQNLRENNLAKILSFVIAQNEKYPNLSSFKNLINKIFVLYQGTATDQSENYNKFINAVIENINVLQKSLINLDQYISSNGTINEDKLYTGQIGGFTSQVGGLIRNDQLNKIIDKYKQRRLKIY